MNREKLISVRSGWTMLPVTFLLFLAVIGLFAWFIYTAAKLNDPNFYLLVSALLVVLCGEHDAQPVINAGTLYT